MQLKNTRKSHTPLTITIINPNHYHVFDPPNKAYKNGLNSFKTIPNSSLCFVYKAGPCGYWMYRLLTRLGHDFFEAASSLITQNNGVRIKTNKRDAILIAKLMRSGDCDPTYVPEAALYVPPFCIYGCHQIQKNPIYL